MAATRCTATTAKGLPCKGWAVEGTDPPRCSSHGGSRSRPGAPEGNANAAKHGAYAAAHPTSIGEQIDDLDQRIARLGKYIDDHADQLAPRDYLALLDLHSKMIGRVTRVRKARQQMGGGVDQALTCAISEALDAISEEWGIEL
jgi:hypothetical protein